MNGEIKDYRQPMVTSLGIIFGFLLNFLAEWGINNGEPQGRSEWLVLAVVVVALGLMALVLFLILHPTKGTADPGRYYARILRLYLGAICTAFLGLALAVLL
ncbi:MAG: hypothetical protein V9F04_04495 [Dermatophilaceae bacterium]